MNYYRVGPRSQEEILLDDAEWDAYCYQRDQAWNRLLVLARLWERKNGVDPNGQEKQGSAPPIAANDKDDK